MCIVFTSQASWMSGFNSCVISRVIQSLSCPGAQWRLLSLLPVFYVFPSLLSFLPAYLGRSVDGSHFHWSRLSYLMDNDHLPTYTEINVFVILVVFLETLNS